MPRAMTGPAEAGGLAALAALVQNQPRSTSRASIGSGNKHSRAMAPHPMPHLPANIADAIVASTGNNPVITDAAYVLGQVCIYAMVEVEVVSEVLKVLTNAARSAPQLNFLHVANAVSHRIARDGETDVRRALVDEINESSVEHESKSRRLSDSLQGHGRSTVSWACSATRRLSPSCFPPRRHPEQRDPPPAPATPPGKKTHHFF